MRCNLWEPAVPFNRTAAGVEETKIRAPCQKGTIDMEARARLTAASYRYAI